MMVVSMQNFTIGMLRYPHWLAKISLTLDGRVLRIMGRRAVHLVTPTKKSTTNDVELVLS